MVNAAGPNASKESSRLPPDALHTVLQRARPAVITYGLVSLPAILTTLNTRRKGPISTRLRLALSILLNPKRTTIKLAAYPALVPIVYQALLPYIQEILPEQWKTYTSEVLAIVCSPLALLLPQGLRVYLSLYVFTSAISTFLKSASPRDQQSKEGKQWRDYLPPVWILNMIGNSFMKWSWYNEKGVFPKSYEKLILDHSPNYVPRDRPPFAIRDYLETTRNPLVEKPVPGGHIYHVCQTLHPDTPSCTKNYIKAWVEEAPIVAKWVAGFGALSTAASLKGKILEEPMKAFTSWLSYTIRGTAYVTGSVQTVWGVTCLIQRLFPPTFMRMNRWLINGSIASLWVLALPPKRRSDISIYVARISALSMWRAWLNHGGWSVKYGELGILMAGWIALLRLREGGWRLEGVVRRTLRFVEGKPKSKEVAPPKVEKPEVKKELEEPEAAKLSRSVSVADSGFATEVEVEVEGAAGSRVL